MMDANAPITVVGSMSGRNIIGEVTEAVHKYLMDGYEIMFS